MNERHITITVLIVLMLVAACTGASPTNTPTSPADTPAPSTTTIPPTVTKTPSPPANATPVPSTATYTPTPGVVPTGEGLSEAETATLASLEKVDDYPLYTMRYHGAYDQATSSDIDIDSSRVWACSLFAALGDPDNRLYGRNFDWEYSPLVLLFTDPPDGYASVSTVDIAYLGFGGQAAGDILDLPLAERRALLDAPFWPFDGMNEHGLAVGMAAVPSGDMRPDPGKQTIDSLGVIREILDHARDVDEAVEILKNYNIDWSDGPALHYLIADASGRSTLVEFYQGEMVLFPNQTPWHLATNFLRASTDESTEGMCGRYDKIDQRLADDQGRISVQDAMDLLAQVSQSNTQWSIVYAMSSGNTNVSVGRAYDNLYTFPLSFASK